MGKFGWSYPPGCSGPPEGPEPHPDSERVAEILDAAGVDQGVIDQVCAIVDALGAQTLRDCPQCLEAHERQLVQTETVAREAGASGHETTDSIDPLRAMLRDSHAADKMIGMAGLVRSLRIDDRDGVIESWCKWLHGLGEQISREVEQPGGAVLSKEGHDSE